MIPEEYESTVGKFKSKGLICFEEITDYSVITDKKVSYSETYCFFIV